MDDARSSAHPGPGPAGEGLARPAFRIPGYRVEKCIGQGGMAAVYLAIQESLDRPLALKILNAVHADDPKYAQRFVDEGRIIAALNHRNVITIHDVGVADGLLYISMELVDGGDLTGRMGRPWAPAEALALIRTLGEALAFAHRAGVAHRDVKPANVLFRGDGTVLLTDFGIAKRMESDATIGGTILGTPGYLSPEQARGEKVDGRTDIYSLGAMLYEMLVGTRPYVAKTPIDTILKQLQEPAPALPAPLARYQPLLDRMLARSPDDRFPSMEAMLAAVEEAASGGPPGAKRPARRGLVLGGLAAAVMIAAAATVVVDGGAGDAGGLAPPSAGGGDTGADGATPKVVPTPAAGSAHLPAVPLHEIDPLRARVEELNALGRTALDQGRLMLPRGNSAFGYFREALGLAPDDPTARAGLDEIATHHARRADRHMAEKDFAAAREQAELGLLARPGDARLTALSRDAGEALARIDRLLALGDRALRDRRLTTPANDNALYYYDSVLAIQPDNREAKDGKARIVRAYAELAEERIARYQYADAQELIRRGLEVKPGDRDLQKLRKRAQIDKLPKHMLRDLKGLFD